MVRSAYKTPLNFTDVVEERWFMPNPILDTKGLMDVVQPVFNLELNLTDAMLPKFTGWLRYKFYYKLLQMVQGLEETPQTKPTTS